VRSHDLDVPVILMTGLPNIDGAIEAMDLGALTYIKKPFEPGVLDAALVRAAKLAALARAKRDAIDAGVGGSPVSNEQAALTASFERALEAIWIAFQPIVDGKSHKTIGYEALMRSNEATMPMPGAILDAAERLGRVHDVGRRVRERVAAAFQRMAGTDTPLFVNVHSDDFLDHGLFASNAARTRVTARLGLEVTRRQGHRETGRVRRRA